MLFNFYVSSFARLDSYVNVAAAAATRADTGTNTANFTSSITAVQALREETSAMGKGQIGESSV